MCLGLIDSKKTEIELVPYEVDQFDGRTDSRFSALAEHVRKPLSGPCDVHVRHQWPPCFDPPKEGAWVMIQPWEFGGIPAQWVAPMRELVDELWVPTSWVRDCYIKSGVPAEKVVVVPNGVDTTRFTPEGPHFQLRTSKRFKFLFLGGTIQRKGIDVLLEAYRHAFSATDEVCLVIKGQAGMTYQGTELDAILADLAKDPNCPEIEYRVDALDEAALVSLYRACDAFVLPYRGEGFGLPIAEAMACGLPVIVTGRGAAMDFVTEEWAYLVKSEPRSVPTVDQFRAPLCGFWLEEPDEASLIEQMHHAFAHPEEAKEKGQKGRAYAEANLGWDRSTQIILERVEALSHRVPVRMCRFNNRPSSDAPRCLFHLAPKATSTTWVQVLLAYANAFQPGDPVALGLLVPESHRDDLTQAVLQLLQRAGHTSFPDVMVLDGESEIEAWRQDGGEAIDLGQWESWKGHPLLDRLERSLALFAKS
jgi:glycosyltransferase involved in cell wall biosynthesis